MPAIADAQGPAQHLVRSGRLRVAAHLGRRGQHALPPAVGGRGRRAPWRGGQREQPRRGARLVVVHEPRGRASHHRRGAGARCVQPRAHPRSGERGRRDMDHRQGKGQRILTRFPCDDPREGQVPLQGRAERSARASQRGEHHRRGGLQRRGLQYVVRADRLLPAVAAQAHARPHAPGQLRRDRAARRRR